MTNHHASDAPVFIGEDVPYEHIRIPADTEFNENHQSFDLGDGGTWQNKLIDLTASGAEMHCTVFHDNWTIRDVAVIGVNESTSGSGAWTVRVNSGSATGAMKNIYMPHGDGGGDSSNATVRDAPNVFVDKNHAGTLRFQGFYSAQSSDNGIYASAPGVSDGAGGAVEMESCYADRCSATGLRLGSDNSYWHNCAAMNGLDQGFRLENGATVDATDCDAGGNRLPDFKVFSGTLTLTRCYADDGSVSNDSGTVNGSLGAHPGRSPPPGCPQTANEALTAQRFDAWNF